LPFQHESLLVDRKDKKLSQAEKRLAKRSYELEKQASTRPGLNAYYGGYQGSYSTSGGGIINAAVPPAPPIRQESPPPYQRIFSSAPPIYADSRQSFGGNSLLERKYLLDSIRCSFANAFGMPRPPAQSPNFLSKQKNNEVLTLSDSD
jgi:hypothetical protein